MDFIKGILPTGQQQREERSSLMAEWNKYSQGVDMESGSAADHESQLFGGSATVNNAATSVSSFLTSAYGRVADGASNLSNMQAPVSIPTGQQMMYFFCFMGAGIFFLILAFTIALPTIILSPSKFALSFTLGCTSMMMAFASLKGWQQQLQHMFSRERMPFSAAYLGSIGATIYSAVVLKSYIMSLVCSGLQVVALMYYVMSYFPGGASGVKFMLTVFYKAVLSCMSSVTRMF